MTAVAFLERELARAKKRMDSVYQAHLEAKDDRITFTWEKFLRVEGAHDAIKALLRRARREAKR